MQDWRALPCVFVVAPDAMASLVASTAHPWRAARLQPELRLLDSHGARLSPLRAGFFARAFVPCGDALPAAGVRSRSDLQLRRWLELVRR